jgi:hypothetical protein
MSDTNEYRVKGRWYWDASRTRLVPEGSLEAAYLAYPDGDVITVDQARTLGLPTGEPAEKLGPRPENKMVGRPPNKRSTP